MPASSLQFNHQLPGTPAIDVTNDAGSVWTEFLAYGPADANLETTPVPTGRNTSYNPPWPVTKVTLQIIDLNNTNNVLSGQTSTVIVGQQMNLGVQLNVTNALLQNSMLTNFQWTVPGYAISNYVVAPDSSSAMVVTNFPTTNSTTKFFWVDGGSNLTVQCSATINNGLTVTGRAVFDVSKPKIDWIGSITGSVAVDSNYFQAQLAGYPGTTWVHFGDSVGASGTVTHGIVFTESNVDLNGCGAEYNKLFCVQIVTNLQVELCGTNGISIHQTGSGLDNGFPYDLLNVDLELYPSGDSYDSPGQICRPVNYSVSDLNAFQMYLMFQTQDTNSIPVPLKVINWNWSGAANNIPPWNLSTSNATITANNAPTTQFPQWSGNITNQVTFTNNICN